MSTDGVKCRKVPRRAKSDVVDRRNRPTIARRKSSANRFSFTRAQLDEAWSDHEELLEIFSSVDKNANVSVLPPVSNTGTTTVTDLGMLSFHPSDMSHSTPINNNDNYKHRLSGLSSLDRNSNPSFINDHNNWSFADVPSPQKDNQIHVSGFEYNRREKPQSNIGSRISKFEHNVDPNSDEGISLTRNLKGCDFSPNQYKRSRGQGDGSPREDDDSHRRKRYESGDGVIRSSLPEFSTLAPSVQQELRRPEVLQLLQKYDPGNPMAKRSLESSSSEQSDTAVKCQSNTDDQLQREHYRKKVENHYNRLMKHSPECDMLSRSWSHPGDHEDDTDVDVYRPGIDHKIWQAVDHHRSQSLDKSWEADLDKTDQSVQSQQTINDDRDRPASAPRVKKKVTVRRHDSVIKCDSEPNIPSKISANKCESAEMDTENALKTKYDGIVKQNRMDIPGAKYNKTEFQSTARITPTINSGYSDQNLQRPSSAKLTPSNKRNNLDEFCVHFARTSSVSSDRSSRIDPHTYQSYAAGILNSSQRSEPFLTLQSHYTTLERIAEIEEQMSSVKPHGAEDEMSSYQLEDIEELNDLYAELEAAQERGEIYFDTNHTEEFKWRAQKDYGLMNKKATLPELWEVYQFQKKNFNTLVKRHKKNKQQYLDFRRSLSFTKLNEKYKDLDDKTRREKMAEEFWAYRKSRSRRSSDASSVYSTQSMMTGSYIEIMEKAAEKKKSRALYGYHIKEKPTSYESHVKSLSKSCPDLKSQNLHVRSQSAPYKEKKKNGSSSSNFQRADSFRHSNFGEDSERRTNNEGYEIEVTSVNKNEKKLSVLAPRYDVNSNQGLSVNSVDDERVKKNTNDQDGAARNSTSGSNENKIPVSKRQVIGGESDSVQPLSSSQNVQLERQLSTESQSHMYTLSGRKNKIYLPTEEEDYLTGLRRTNNNQSQPNISSETGEPIYAESKRYRRDEPRSLDRERRTSKPQKGAVSSVMSMFENGNLKHAATVKSRPAPEYAFQRSKSERFSESVREPFRQTDWHGSTEQSAEPNVSKSFSRFQKRDPVWSTKEPTVSTHYSSTFEPRSHLGKYEARIRSRSESPLKRVESSSAVNQGVNKTDAEVQQVMSKMPRPRSVHGSVVTSCDVRDSASYQNTARNDGQMKSHDQMSRPLDINPMRSSYDFISVSTSKVDNKSREQQQPDRPITGSVRQNGDNARFDSRIEPRLVNQGNKNTSGYTSNVDQSAPPSGSDANQAVDRVIDMMYQSSEPVYYNANHSRIVNNKPIQSRSSVNMSMEPSVSVGQKMVQQKSHMDAIPVFTATSQTQPHTSAFRRHDSTSHNSIPQGYSNQVQTRYGQNANLQSDNRGKEKNSLLYRNEYKLEVKVENTDATAPKRSLSTSALNKEDSLNDPSYGDLEKWSGVEFTYGLNSNKMNSDFGKLQKWDPTDLTKTSQSTLATASSNDTLVIRGSDPDLTAESTSVQQSFNPLMNSYESKKSKSEPNLFEIKGGVEKDVSTSISSSKSVSSNLQKNPGQLRKFAQLKAQYEEENRQHGYFTRPIPRTVSGDLKEIRNQYGEADQFSKVTNSGQRSTNGNRSQDMKYVQLTSGVRTMPPQKTLKVKEYDIVRPPSPAKIELGAMKHLEIIEDEWQKTNQKVTVLTKDGATSGYGSPADAATPSITSLSSMSSSSQPPSSNQNQNLPPYRPLEPPPYRPRSASSPHQPEPIYSSPMKPRRQMDNGAMNANHPPIVRNNAAGSQPMAAHAYSTPNVPLTPRSYTHYPPSQNQLQPSAFSTNIMPRHAPMPKSYNAHDLPTSAPDYGARAVHSDITHTGAVSLTAYDNSG